MDRRKDEREQPDHKEARSGIEGQLQCGQHLPAVTHNLLHTSSRTTPAGPSLASW
jgi:hypothetical protein